MPLIRALAIVAASLSLPQLLVAADAIDNFNGAVKGPLPSCVTACGLPASFASNAPYSASTLNALCQKITEKTLNTIGTCAVVGAHPCSVDDQNYALNIANLYLDACKEAANAPPPQATTSTTQRTAPSASQLPNSATATAISQHSQPVSSSTTAPSYSTSTLTGPIVGCEAAAACSATLKFTCKSQGDITCLCNFYQNLRTCGDRNACPEVYTSVTIVGFNPNSCASLGNGAFAATVVDVVGGILAGTIMAIVSVAFMP